MIYFTVLVNTNYTWAMGASPISQASKQHCLVLKQRHKVKILKAKVPELLSLAFWIYHFISL
jgi:hypothetical protein